MDQFHKKDILGVPRPLLDDGPPPPRGGRDRDRDRDRRGGGGAASSSAPPARTQLFYPVRDLTRLPDRPDGGLAAGLRGRYMESPVAHAALLPNHLEVSYQALSTIMLWPPLEVFHPMAIDYELAYQRLAALRRRPLRSGTGRRKKRRRAQVSARTVGLVPRSS